MFQEEGTACANALDCAFKKQKYSLSGWHEERALPKGTIGTVRPVTHLFFIQRAMDTT